MDRVKSYSHGASFSRTVAGTGPCCRSSQSLLPTHTTCCYLIHGSLEAEDEVFLMGFSTADGCRKYRVTLLRRILLCAICLLSPAPKGAQDIQPQEARSEHCCSHGASASWTSSNLRNETSLWCSQDLTCFGWFWMYRYWFPMNWSGEMQILGVLLTILPEWVEADLGPHQPKAAQFHQHGLCAFPQTT